MDKVNKPKWWDEFVAFAVKGNAMALAVGTIIGAAIIGVLRNALVLLSVDSYFQTLIIGAVIIVAVSIDQIRKSKA